MTTMDLTAARPLDEPGLATLFHDAHTANAFRDEPVSRQTLERIYDLVKWAPTAMNSQPMRIAWVTSPEAHDRLVPLMNPGNQAKTAQAPVVALVAADLDFHDELPVTFPHAPGIRDSLDGDEAGRAQVARMNASIQLGYLILAIRAVGLSAGPMGGLDHEAAAREFFPGGRHQVLAAVNIGHAGPDAHRPRNPRLDYDLATSTH
jgi:3-hydroxypropanoate dehydrogenase